MTQLIAVIVLLLLLVIGNSQPPKDIPTELMEEYTLNGAIPVEYFYVDDTLNGSPTHYKYSYETIKSYINSNRKLFMKLGSMHEQLITVQNKTELEMLALLAKEKWIFYAILKNYEYFFHGKIANIGSTEPRIESIVLTMDVSEVVVVEYNELTYNHSLITTISNVDNQFKHFYACNSKYHNYFDVVFAINSLDHDGLGRYGDPIDPNADFHSMMKIFSVLKPGGLLFLSVPIGPDLLIFNLHRRYGRIRLPLLLQHYEVRDIIGWDDEKLDVDSNYRMRYEPIFVLQKPMIATEPPVHCLDDEEKEDGDDVKGLDSFSLEKLFKRKKRFGEHFYRLLSVDAATHEDL